MMNTFVRRTISTKLAVISAIAPFFFGTSSTFAQQSNRGRNCRGVYVKANNNTGNQIKIIGLKYSNINAYTKLGEWKVEFTRNQVIPNGQPWQTTRNLEGVNNLPTQIKIRYRTLKRRTRRGRPVWGLKVHEVLSSTKTCIRGQQYEINI